MWVHKPTADVTVAAYIILFSLRQNIANQYKNWKTKLLTEQTVLLTTTYFGVNNDARHSHHSERRGSSVRSAVTLRCHLSTKHPEMLCYMAALVTASGERNTLIFYLSRPKRKHLSTDKLCCKYCSQNLTRVKVQSISVKIYFKYKK